MDYGGQDRTACKEIRKAWAAAPRAPKIKASRDGTVRREVFDAWIEAKEKHAADLKLHCEKIVEMGQAFLVLYPGSRHEKEIGQATLMGQYRSGDHEASVSLADAFMGRYPALEVVCLGVKGDALDKLKHYEEAADVYGVLFDATTGRRAIVAAKKHIAALIRSGQGPVAKEKAAVVLSTVPRARRAIDAMLRPLALLGEPLPATPGATTLFSEEVVDWGRSRGEVTIVLIWSTQYAEGEAALKAADELARRLAGDVPFQIIGVALSEFEDEQKIHRWLNDNELSDWPQVLQQGPYCKSPVLKAWGLAIGDEACKIPTTFLLDRAGVVRHADVPVGKHMEKLIRAMR